jgi:hypothetical protein
MEKIHTLAVHEYSRTRSIMDPHTGLVWGYSRVPLFFFFAFFFHLILFTFINYL